MNDWYKKGELPPVGTECMVNVIGNNAFIEAKIKYISPDYTVYNISSDSVNYTDVGNQTSKLEFKPLKSKQELEREAFISEVGCMITRIDEEKRIQTNCELLGASGNEVAEVLFDAGYRKVNTITKAEFNNAYNNQTGEQLYHWLINCNHLVSEVDNG